MKHQQHSKLTKPYKGVYGQHEISILGSNCHRIGKLARMIAEEISDLCDAAYIDADHKSPLNEETTPSVFSWEFTNKISYHRLDVSAGVSDFERSAMFNASHLTMVNGNHEKGMHQLVIIDPSKEAKLEKRKEQLTHVIGLVSLETTPSPKLRSTKEGEEEKGELPEYIKELIPNYKELPVVTIDDRAGMKKLVANFLIDRLPKIKGLILGGGKSTRMGVDKAFLDYHGKPQHLYLKEELAELCEATYVSCREEQAELFPTALPDTFLHLGAYGGILSAFQQDPNAAWFSVACDVPLLNKSTLEKLVAQRDPSKLATCFYNSETGFPEPLITIWEPRAYPVLLHYMSMGYSCARKVLINNDVKVVKLENEEVLLNANTMDEREKALGMLQKSQL
ncbi:molybdopterin-guanine dinucleotide biosynthesis protein MobA [Robertkochia marina]|uniref:Molybdopterin-guanine dinucleotide biosynthesis protein MobA n=1 Tax=Robertkochia marina TaxID=1227945 RepID=A0A4S3M3Z0_9FLAO|nr:NTP transferase domain-containing protein [Robertkochia marina]THD68867.1 molybdopterin-guanine dinucleotide biosynthesis protein MobA [Robertkochia marina]TRZ41113.1 molybdopterin-guanine dinucleotide biosynthesis protein MobA [Robertkochia marina]